MDNTKAKETIAAAKDKMLKTTTHLEEELISIRAGKANPAMLNNIAIDYYGSLTPLPQVASITSPDARTILIQPWEKPMIAPIEKAIMQANIGFTPQNNGENIRINVPPLTEERRKDLVKVARKYTEEAKVAIRNIRRDANDSLKKMEKDKTASEDDIKKATEAIQKVTDAQIAKADQKCQAKEKEIMEI